MILAGLVAVVWAACTANEDCTLCIDELPGSIFEGLACQLCDNKGSPRCVGDFLDNAGLISCDVKAKTRQDCAAKFPGVTRKSTVEPTLAPTPQPPVAPTLPPPPPDSNTSSVPFFTATPAPPGGAEGSGDNTVAIAVGVVVALVVLGLFVLAGVYMLVKYRKQAHAYPLPHDASGRPSFSLHSGRVLDDPTTYSGRNTYTDSSNPLSQRYVAMPYSQQPVPTATPESTIPRSDTAKQQYYDLNVIKPPPKDVDLDGQARDAASSRQGYVMAEELPDIPAGYSGQRGNVAAQEAQDDIDVLNELIAPMTTELPATTGEHVAADLVPVSERMDMDSGRLANEFAAMQAMLDDV